MSTKIIETVRTLKAVGKLLDDKGIPWWIDYGTLLGATRDGRMMPWDKDADIGFFNANIHNVVGGSHRQIEGLGFSFKYYRPATIGGHWIHVSPRSCHGLDLWPWELRDGLYHRPRYEHKELCPSVGIPPEKLLPLRRIRWEGIEVWAPADIEWFCEHRYGPNWRTPKKWTEWIAEARSWQA